jgi:hypothetical protein
MKEACKWEKFQIAVDQKEWNVMFLYDSSNKISGDFGGLSKSLP